MGQTVPYCGCSSSKRWFYVPSSDLKQARFITVREAALLMTFPKDYSFVGAKSVCYKMIGNAVPVNFARAIADTIYEVISQ